MNVCRSTLRPLAEDGFCKSAREELADGKVIPTHLDFRRGELPASEHTKENRHLFSVSGMQEKIGLTLDRGKFSICNQGGRLYSQAASDRFFGSSLL